MQAKAKNGFNSTWGNGSGANRAPTNKNKRSTLLREVAFEALESRQMLSGTPVLQYGGGNSTNQGASYSLNLIGGAAAGLDHWNVNWGDSTTTQPGGSDVVATHVYTDGLSNHTIVATGSIGATILPATPLTPGGGPAQDGTLDTA